MSIDDFIKKLHGSPRPVVVDFWAPWCAPCRAIDPVVKELSREYAGRVDVWKINADEEPGLLRSLGIFGIPTFIACSNGLEVWRRTGAASTGVLSAIFEAAISGNRPVGIEPAPANRLLRLGAGLALIILAVMSGLAGVHWLFAGIGGLIMFTAVYDRCPIYRTISTRLAHFLRRAHVRQGGK